MLAGRVCDGDIGLQEQILQATHDAFNFCDSLIDLGNLLWRDGLSILALYLEATVSLHRIIDCDALVCKTGSPAPLVAGARGGGHRELGILGDN